MVETEDLAEEKEAPPPPSNAEDMRFYGGDRRFGRGKGGATSRSNGGSNTILNPFFSHSIQSQLRRRCRRSDSTRKNAMIGRGSIIAAAVTAFFETLRKRYSSTFSTLLVPIFLVVKRLRRIIRYLLQQCILIQILGYVYPTMVISKMTPEELSMLPSVSQM
ncbi:hypothetical protein F2Q69_00054143 [Brassica cretica]|uniref:Uncharacterized protein n=2 Tax=Brassica TaxID=3705 RepID=A0A0D3D6I0_BRAOL|nr:hypothetical protein F2Q69_00054143 [Brassica cretica]